MKLPGNVYTQAFSTPILAVLGYAPEANVSYSEEPKTIVQALIPASSN
jgi:hypothetical protein